MEDPNFSACLLFPFHLSSESSCPDFLGCGGQDNLNHPVLQENEKLLCIKEEK